MFYFSSLDMVYTLQRAGATPLHMWRSLTHIWSSGVTQAGLVLHVGADFIHAASLQDAPDLCGGWSRA